MLILLLLFASVGYAGWLPIPPPTPYQPAIDTRGWDVRDVSDCSCPNTRSIFSIIWGCLGTMFLCTWVSVHPNVPPAGETRAAAIFRRVRLTFWALIGPEMILVWSFRQWVAAKEITKKFKDRQNWTMAHSFLLAMGGFVLCKGDETMGTLSFELLEQFAKDEEVIFPTITAEEIDDRNKGDPLSKFLVILQSSWFVAQCIARAVQGLAVTELEVATLAFCSLNALMYFFWWHKPVDVQCRIPVYLKPSSDYVHVSKIRRAGEMEDMRMSSWLVDEALNPEGDEASLRKHSYIIQWYDKLSHSIGRMHIPAGNDIVEMFVMLKYEVIEKYQTSNVFIFILTSLFTIPAAILSLQLLIFIAFTAGVMMWIVGIPETMRITPGSDRVHTFYAPGIGNGDDLKIWAYDLFSVSGAIFGGLHCIAWSFNFPSRQEAIIWRALSIYITTAPISLSLFFRSIFSKEMLKETNGFDPDTLLLWISNIIGTFVILLLCLYVPARLMLLVEAFTLLRKLPPDGLLDVDWSSFVPHL